MPETFFFYKTRNICSYIGVKNASTSHFADCAKPTAEEQLNVSASNVIGYDDGCVVSITFFFYLYCHRFQFLSFLCFTFGCSQQFTQTQASPCSPNIAQLK